MKKQRWFSLAVGLLAAFVLWTAVVCLVDVQAVGPQGSAVGLATLNQAVHRLFGVHLWLYALTDWLGLIPCSVGLGFALLGLIQWVRRKKLCRVDGSLLVLGGFYLVVLAAYLLFEELPINARPVLLDGRLETSYPSSTTLLTLCVMPTAAMQLHNRLKQPSLRRCAVWGCVAFAAFMVGGRLVSGVHWFSDIVGGVLLSGGLVLLYAAIIHRLSHR